VLDERIYFDQFKTHVALIKVKSTFKNAAKMFFMPQDLLNFTPKYCEGYS